MHTVGTDEEANWWEHPYHAHPTCGLSQDTMVWCFNMSSHLYKWISPPRSVYYYLIVQIFHLFIHHKKWENSVCSISITQIANLMLVYRCGFNIFLVCSNGAGVIITLHILGPECHWKVILPMTYPTDTMLIFHSCASSFLVSTLLQGLWTFEIINISQPLKLPTLGFLYGLSMKHKEQRLWSQR